MYELRLVKDNEFVTLESGSKYFCEKMLQWYKSHSDFFNGVFIVKEVIKC